MRETTCTSCGMQMKTTEDHPVGHADSEWCKYCATPTGKLQSFDDRLANFTQWSMKKDGLPHDEAVQKARHYMSQMPAWHNHPQLTGTRN